MSAVGLLGLLCCASCFAQGAGPDAGAALAFRLDHGAAPLPSFVLTVHLDGATRYEVSYPAEPPRPNPYSIPMAPAAPTREIVDVMLTREHAVSLFRMVKAANGCGSKARHVANLGLKTITYTPAGGPPTICTFNYSDDKNLQSLTDAVQGIAMTLDDGRAMTQELRYDHLALDREMELLVEQVKDGRAIDMEVIAPTLHAVADDPEVLERVRASASKLLAQAGS